MHAMAHRVDLVDCLSVMAAHHNILFLEHSLLFMNGNSFIVFMALFAML